MYCAKTGPIQTGRGWLFEPKMDGFRCLTCTHGRRFRARSRRGWAITDRLPELTHALPADVQLGGELDAWDANGHPDWYRVGERVPHGDTSIGLTLMVFDVLAVEGLSVMEQPYSERRALLERSRSSDRPCSLWRPLRTDAPCSTSSARKVSRALSRNGFATRTGRASASG
jgi:bifunctional non-homologous end joining protein LigD